ncbi:hypothetical protein ACGFNY_43885 [Streptomyces chartreusis]|uniref:hypothetical protein n=1 Tax=Streptomyces chartreusis TaxID=1969 RepID=UPI00370F8840
MTPQEFDEEFGPEFTPRTSPYGNTVQPVKPGLTRRGRIAIAVAATAIAGTGFFWYQAQSAQVAKDAKETAALQIQLQQIELEKMKELNKANATHSKEKATEDAERKKFVDACIDADKGLVGKQMGVTYSSVVADCQDQFQAEGSQGVDGSDMAAAGSASDTEDGGIGINSTGLLAITGGLGLVVVLTAARSRKAHAA